MRNIFKPTVLYSLLILALSIAFATTGSAALAQESTSGPRTEIISAVWPTFAIGVAICVAIFIVWRMFYFWFRGLEDVTRLKLERSTRFFVADLTGEQIDGLETASIPIEKVVMAGQDGIVCNDRATLDRVVEALDGEIVAALPTTAEGCAFVVLRFANAEIEDDDQTGDERVIIKRTAGFFSWKRRRYENFLEDSIKPLVQSVLSESLKRPVWLLHANGERIREGYRANDKQFQVLLYGYADFDRITDGPATVFGFQRPETATFMSPRRESIPIVDPETGRVVADLSADKLYINYNLFVKRSPEELAILVRILQAALLEMDPRRFMEGILRALPLPEEARKTIGKRARKGRSVFDEGFKRRTGFITRTLLRTIMAPSIGKDIYVKDCGGRKQTPLTDGMFHIFIHSAGADTPVVDASTKMFGIKRAKGLKTYLPTGMGLPLVSDDGGIYGEIVGDNLYVFLNNPLGQGSRADAEFFARLALHASRVVQEEEAAAVGDAGDKIYGDKLVEYAVESAASLDSEKSYAKLVASADELPQAQTDFSNRLKELIGEQNDLARLDQYPRTALGAEFDSLLAIKKVLDVEVTRSRINVRTDTLYCVDPRTGKRHEIGKFEIIIRIGDDNDDAEPVRWLNKTRTVNTGNGGSMHAPHVSTHGKACYGNTKDLFPMLIEKREFASVVELAIAFVESVNTSDSWGQHIHRWPEAED